MRRRSSVLLAAATLLTLSACASGGDSQSATTPATPSTSGAASSPSGSPSPTEEERDQVVEVRVSVADGKVKPATRRVEVERDSQVRLLITSDVDDDVHVHGYDIEATLEAGRTTTVELVADQQGVFEVETHDGGLTLLQLQVG
ncbi:MAG TPA: hypothetical protein VFV76_16710 [Actinomycetes bacterium]|nr:hypothetical protein [Actinomycetes bacterium]